MLHVFGKGAVMAAFMLAGPVLTGPVLAAGHVTAEGAWIMLPAAADRPAGGFVTLSSSSDKDDALVSASSPDARKIELHSVSHDNGVMKMETEESLTIPAGGKLELKPGGAAHMMIFGLREGIKAGATIPVTLTLGSGETLDVRAEARPPMAMARTRAHSAN